MGTTNTGSIRRKFKQESATKRGEQRSLRSPKQQLQMLDERLGTGVGAKRERERLLALISKSKKS